MKLGLRVLSAACLLTISGLAALNVIGCAGADEGEDMATAEGAATGISEEISDGTNCRARGDKVRLKVMSINLRHDVDQWEKRFPLIADEIVRLQPDVIGLQEIEIGKDQMDRLQRLLADRSGGRSPYPHTFQHRKTGIVGFFSGEGVGIMSRYPFEEKRDNDLGEHRVAVYARIKLPSGSMVDFYNTHLHSEGGDEGNAWRVKQAKEVAEWTKELGDCHPAIVVGDMNASEGSEPIKAFLDAKFVDSYRFVHPDRNAAPGFTSPIRLTGDVRNQKPTRRIDWIFAKRPNGLRALPVASEVAFENHDSNFLYPSDHLGLQTTYELQL